MEINIVNRSRFPLPKYATVHSAGLDLRADIQQAIILKHGISIVNSPGTIDPDYRGEIKVILVNLSDTDFSLEPGERIAQMVVARFEHVNWNEVETLSTTERGEGGFGHTGVK